MNKIAKFYTAVDEIVGATIGEIISCGDGFTDAEKHAAKKRLADAWSSFSQMLNEHKYCSPEWVPTIDSWVRLKFAPRFTQIGTVRWVNGRVAGVYWPLAEMEIAYPFEDLAPIETPRHPPQRRKSRRRVDDAM